MKKKQQTKVSRPEKQQTRYVSQPYYRNEKQKIRNERELRKCNTHNRAYSRYKNGRSMFNSPQGHVFHKNGTTYIGKRVNKYFLGGGKPGHGQ